MNHSNSSTTRGSSGTGQSYMLLAVGIVVALALPYLLQPREEASSGAPAAAMSSHPIRTSE